MVAVAHARGRTARVGAEAPTAVAVRAKVQDRAYGVAGGLSRVRRRPARLAAVAEVVPVAAAEAAAAVAAEAAARVVRAERAVKAVGAPVVGGVAVRLRRWRR